jgi:hypothetical protein
MKRRHAVSAAAVAGDRSVPVVASSTNDVQLNTQYTAMSTAQSAIYQTSLNRPSAQQYDSVEKVNRTLNYGGISHGNNFIRLTIDSSDCIVASFLKSSLCRFLWNECHCI